MIVIRKFCEVIGHQYMFCESLNSCWCRKMHIFHNLLWEACWLVGFGYFTFLYVDFLHFLKFLLSLQSLCLKNDKCSTFHLFSIFLTLSYFLLSFLSLFLLFFLSSWEKKGRNIRKINKMDYIIQIEQHELFLKFWLTPRIYSYLSKHKYVTKKSFKH